MAATVLAMDCVLAGAEAQRGRPLNSIVSHHQMSLAYGIKSPRDMLAKAERDLERLERAHADQNEAAASDALFDFAVALTSLKDWLKEHPAKSYTNAEVESLVASSLALDSFRDIANSGKHRQIRKYTPETIDTAASATSQVSFAMIWPEARASPKPFGHLKIIRADRTRHRAVDLAKDAVREWREFMRIHNIEQ